MWNTFDGNAKLRALVTGGAGFIGSHIADRLIENGAEVRIIDDLSGGYEANVNPKAELLIGDIADQPFVAKAMSGVELVFHEAAHRAVLRSVERPLETDNANVHGTLTILTCARDAGTRRVVYASSSSIYGNTEVFPTPESTDKMPRSPYAVSKLAAEHYCRVFWELYGLETVALRYFNVYGPRQRPDSAYAAVIPLFIASLKSLSSPSVHGDGLQSRDFSYIEDVVDANMHAGFRPAEDCSGKAFNIAGGATYSLMDMLEILNRILGVQIEPIHIEPRAGDIRRSQADISAAQQYLGYQPKIDFAEGLKRTVQSIA